MFTKCSYKRLVEKFQKYAYLNIIFFINILCSHYDKMLLSSNFCCNSININSMVLILFAFILLFYTHNNFQNIYQSDFLFNLYTIYYYIPISKL